MVVAVKKDVGFVVGVTGCDIMGDMSNRDLALEENVPFWKVKGAKDCYVVANDVGLGVDLLRYSDYIFKDVTDGKSVVEEVIPKMKGLLGKYGQVFNGKEWSGQLLIIKGEKMFLISPFFTVTEMEDAAALGQDTYVLGALREGCNLSAEEKVIFAMRTVEQMRGRKLFPMVLFDTKTKKRKVRSA